MALLPFLKQRMPLYILLPFNMEGFRTLCEGDRVQYDIARRPDGYMAINVTPID